MPAEQCIYTICVHEVHLLILGVGNGLCQFIFQHDAWMRLSDVSEIITFFDRMDVM